MAMNFNSSSSRRTTALELEQQRPCPEYKLFDNSNFVSDEKILPDKIICSLDLMSQARPDSAMVDVEENVRIKTDPEFPESQDLYKGETKATDKESPNFHPCEKLRSDLTPLPPPAALKPTFICGTCELTFEDYKTLKAHDSAHPICNNSSPQGEALQSHQSYSCKVCGKSFTHSSTLSNHEKIHSEKKLECKFCSQLFRLSGHLKRHVIRIHTQERPYSCKICGKKFSDVSGLAAHENIHSGDKPFKCTKCSKKFSGKSKLTLHMRVHDVEDYLECEECSAKFKWKRSLRFHMKTFHLDKVKI